MQIYETASEAQTKCLQALAAVPLQGAGAPVAMTEAEVAAPEAFYIGGGNIEATEAFYIGDESDCEEVSGGSGCCTPRSAPVKELLENHPVDKIMTPEVQRDVGADVVVVPSSASSVAAWAEETAQRALTAAAELDQKVLLALEKAEASDRRLEEYQRELELLWEARARHAALMTATS